MIAISKEIFLMRFAAHLKDLDPENPNSEYYLFWDRDDMEAGLRECLENALLETEQKEC